MNVLIVEKDSNFGGVLKEEISKSSVVKLVDLFSSLEFLSKIQNEVTKYDISIINIDLLSNEIEQVSKISKSIVAITSNSKTFNKHVNSSLFQRVFKMPIDISDFIVYLNKQFGLYKKNPKHVNDTNILFKLSELGFNISHSGTRYLVDSIKISISSNIDKTKIIYEELSKKYMVKASVITWAIYNSVDCAYSNDYDGKMERFFRIYDGRKPTPKYIIEFFTKLCKNSTI